MSRQTMTRIAIIAITGTMALGAVAPAWSAPVISNTALQSAVSSDVSEARYYGGRRYYRNNNGAAIALGVLGVVGAVAAAQAYRHHDPYGYGGYGNPGYYQRGYSYGPGYYGRGW